MGSTFLVLSVWLLLYLCFLSFLYGVFCRREVFYRIRKEGIDVCTNCGYWLRGLGEDVRQCPECGAGRVPLLVPKRETN